MFFTEVILPLSLPKTFTYSISEAEYNFLRPGMRVAVPFGTNKIYTALVCRVHREPPQLYTAREIEQILDEHPVVTEIQLRHWEWIAQYYMCTLGEVYRSAMPSALILESESVIVFDETFSGDEQSFTDDEYLVYQALRQQPVLQMQEIIKILNRKSIFPVIKQLMEKGVASVKEEISETYKPKLVRYIRMAEAWSDPQQLQELLEKLKNAEKQRALVLTWFQLAASGKPVAVKQLSDSAGVPSSIIKALIDKGIFEDYHVQEDRVTFGSDSGLRPELSPAQQAAFDSINKNFESKDVNLLFGVTSSGKTEIYIRLIEEFIKSGKQVLYLLPEIALTTQLVTRLVKYFGDKVAVYHSKYSNNERLEAWYNVLGNKPNAQIVIGARSALFLPFADLGLIIVDEEHEPTFKQHDPAPRYHARDAAIVLAKSFDAKVLLGSATPAIESYFNAQKGKYGFTEIHERFGNVLMPDIELVDLKDKYFRKQMSGHFSDTLIKYIGETLSENGQIILFQNRRGFSPMMECMTCGHVPQCTHCDVSLTYHMHKSQLRCHYCGYAIAKPTHCHACSSTNLTTKGFGTEQVQEELLKLLPNAKVGRMDQDTTRGKYGFDRIIDSFRNRETDILVGTQMLAKGLDFENVRLVGIMNADNMLYHPDFRAFERSYQMMAQVAGRSGRAHRRGKVVIQTFNPMHNIIQQVTQNDYQAMYREQLYERQIYKYPPYYKLIKLTVRHRDFEKLREGANWLFGVLQQNMNMPVLGPEEPPISKIRNEYLRTIMIKIPPGTPLEGTKKTIRKILDSFGVVPQYRALKVTVNVDFY